MRYPQSKKELRKKKYDLIMELWEKEYSLAEIADILVKKGYMKRPWRGTIWKIVRKNNFDKVPQ